MSFSETIFLFFLALIIFGPKKLPEIARQAGRLLAELRRASNEFKSQIETEIAHMEVQQRATEKSETEKGIAALASGTAPQGTVASLSLNPASEPAAKNAAATLAAPIAESTVGLASSPETSIVSRPTAPPAETVGAVADPESQASHV